MVIMQHHVRIGEVARRLVKVDPNAIENIDEHAQLFFANQNYQMAKALYEVLIDIAPDPTNAYLNLGLSCAGIEDVACTREAFEGFLDRAPEDHAYVETVRGDLAGMSTIPDDEPE
jgi:tetratricopeptide (TPR) repeat protein